MTGTVLVIGASRGLGLELVRQYAAAGWRVHATVRDLEEPGAVGRVAGDVTLHRVEVRDLDTVRRLAEVLGSGSVDLVVHNAGVKEGLPADEIMAINAEAPIAAVDALLDAGVVAEGGVVVLMSSRAGSRRGRTGSLGTYGDSKARLNDHLRERAPRWSQAGVVAVAMHPGWVRTDMGGPGASLGVSESVSGMRSVIAGLGPADHGTFVTWDGQVMPW